VHFNPAHCYTTTMPKPRVKTYQQEEEDIEDALTEMAKELKPVVARFAAKFGVPYQRLNNRWKGRPSKSTRSTTK
jgi:hypothetical protein